MKMKEQDYMTPVVRVIQFRMRTRISDSSPYGYDNGNITGYDSDEEQG